MNTKEPRHDTWLRGFMRPAKLRGESDRPAPMIVQGLSFKLLALTILFVMLGEVLIFVPSVGNFRMQWLSDRFSAAHLGALAVEASPETPLANDLNMQALKKLGVLAITLQPKDGKKTILSLAPVPALIDERLDLKNLGVPGFIQDTWVSFMRRGARVISVVGYSDISHLAPPDHPGKTMHHMEVVLSEEQLYQAMVNYAAKILVLSMVLSCFSAGLVYIALRGLFVKPMMRLTHSVINFSRDPENPQYRIVPGGRTDEIGLAEEKLAHMQRQLAEMLKERKRLANLGLAVSKINHDLRNMLASAHLISDRLSAVSDPTVQRFVPKLITTLDRASNFCETTLAYGRAQECPPQRRLLHLRSLCEEIAQDAGLFENKTIDFNNEVPAGLEIDADPGQLHRVLLNICRNAVQALESMTEPHTIRRLSIAAHREGAVVSITLRDTGPGLPEQARAHLFEPFHGSTRAGGTGLGLSIAAELVEAHGGTITLKDVGAGTAFEIVIPDQPVEMARERARRNILGQTA